jgi:DNA polymerase-1
MLGCQILECGLTTKKGHFTLESCVRRYVDEYAYSDQGNLFLEYVTKEVRDTFKFVGDKEFSKQHIVYGALDAWYAFHLYRRIDEKAAKEELQAAIDHDNQFCRVVSEMELNGIYIDQEAWLENAEHSADLIEKLQAELELVDPEVKNWGSSKQVIAAFQKLGVDVSIIDKKTMEIKSSVSEVSLSRHLNKYPFVDAFLKYGKAKKAFNAYGPNFLKNVNQATNRVHSTFWQVKSTGRTSSSNPNMQNIPRDLMYRHCFKAEEGNTLVVADYANQELRVLASKADENAMKEAFWNNEDIHLHTAKLIYKDPTLTAKSKERRMGKDINFTISYGGGASKVASRVGMPRRDAEVIIKEYFAAYPKLKKYLDGAHAAALKNGYIVIDDIIKRKSYIDSHEEYVFCKNHVEYFKAMGWEPRYEIERRYRKLENDIKRLAYNYPIQGTAAEMSKRAGIFLLKEAEKNKKFKILLLVHDEWVLECPEEYAQEVKQILEECSLRASKVFLSGLEAPADALITLTWQK